MGIFNSNGAVELYYDGSKKFETASYGIFTSGDHAVSGNIDIANDTGKIKLGTSADLQIYHDGGHSYIDNSTGSLFVKGDTIKLRGKSADEDLIEAFVNGSVRLYYDNSKKFETLTNGARVQGGLLFGSDTAAANALDDYEEGTWTPTVTTGGVISNTISARYTKIGRMVHWQWYANMGTMTSTALFTFDGLPFSTPSHSQYYYGTGRVQDQNTVVAQVNASSSSAHIYKNGATTLKFNEASGKYVLLSGAYEAT